MDWFVMVLLSAVLLAGFTLVQRRFSLGAADVDEVNTAQAFQFACGLIFVTIAVLAGKPVWAEIAPLNALILAFGYGLASLFLFAALKRVAASIFAVLFATRVIWTAIFAWLVLHDGFTPVKIAAVACIFLAVMLVSYDKDAKQTFKFDKGVLYALAAGLFSGIAAVNDSYILKGDVDVLSYLGPAFLMPGIFLMFVGGRKTWRLPGLLKRADFLKNLVITAVFYAGSSILFYFAIKQAEITMVSVVSQSQVLFAAIGGILFLNERKHMLAKLSGVSLATLGLVLVALG